MQITLPITAFAMTILQNDSEGSYQFLYSFLTTTALTHIVKHTIPDDRPNGGSLGMLESLFPIFVILVLFIISMGA